MTTTKAMGISAQSQNEQTGFPPQIKYIVGNEACERFSYYGMRAILVIFMVKYLAMQESHSKEVYHYFISAAYFLPLLGAYISDRLWGKYKTIFYFSIIYCLGHLALAVFEGSQTGLYWGLGLVAVGTGAIKACVSAHVGDQFGEKNKHMVNRVYDLFYFSVNFGSFFSTLMIPVILTKYGAGWAFGVPGILMAIATYFFWLGRNQYVHVPPAKATGQAGFMPVLIYAMKNQKDRKPGQSYLEVARKKYSKDEVEAAQAAAAIFKIFILVSIFWALFDQQGSSWTLQAEKMDRNFFGMQLESSQIQALNPIMVMILIPLMTYVIYPLVEKMGVKLTLLRKMSAGMLLAALSFVCVGIFQIALDNGHTLSVGWQILPYLIITVSEVMVSITGLEFAYTQAPRSMKSTIMSFWLLTVAVGNYLDGVINGMNKLQGASYFMFFAVLMFVVAVAFAFGASRFKLRDFMSDQGVAIDPSLAEGNA